MNSKVRTFQFTLNQHTTGFTRIYGYSTRGGNDAAGNYENVVRYFDLVYARSSDVESKDTIGAADEDDLAYQLIRMGMW